MVETPLVSIIITSYTTDRLKDTLSLLESIKAQTYPKIETIFIAERSRELYNKLETYVRENGIPQTNVIFNDGEIGLSAARNLGIEEPFSTSNLTMLKCPFFEAIINAVPKY